MQHDIRLENRVRLLACATALLFPLACGNSASEPDRAPQPVAATSVAANAVDPSFDSDRERLRKKTGGRPRTQIAVVDWAAASTRKRANDAPLSAPARELLSGSPVPVLLPDDARLLSAAKATRGEHWYAASMSVEGHTVFVTGNRQETVIPHLDPARAASPDAPLRVARYRGIATVSFRLFGAAYSLEVECADPQHDARCTGDEYALSLVQGLGVAGGAR